MPETNQATVSAHADARDESRSKRSTLVGTVVSTKMHKTITVQVERTFKHAKYGKYLRKRKRYHAHVPEGGCKDGDVVEIMATRPISKLVRWRFVRVVNAAVERGADVAELANAVASGAAKPAQAAAKPTQVAAKPTQVAAKQGGAA